jgi:hypothetical protein
VSGAASAAGWAALSDVPSGSVAGEQEGDVTVKSAQERASRVRERIPSDCASDPWFWPVSPQPGRYADWSAYTQRLHAAIMRERLRGDMEASTLGDHLYVPFDARRMFRP